MLLGWLCPSINILVNCDHKMFDCAHHHLILPILWKAFSPLYIGWGLSDIENKARTYCDGFIWSRIRRSAQTIEYIWLNLNLKISNLGSAGPAISYLDPSKIGNLVISLVYWWWTLQINQKHDGGREMEKEKGMYSTYMRMEYIRTWEWDVSQI